MIYLSALSYYYVPSACLTAMTVPAVFNMITVETVATLSLKRDIY